MRVLADVPYYYGYIQLHEDEYYDSYEEIPYEVHGDWTYLKYPWIGFDTNHAGDSIQDQDREYVNSQCIYVIDQIINSKAL